MKLTRSLIIARQIQAEIGGNVREIQAKVAGFLLMNPAATDADAASFVAVNN